MQEIYRSFEGKLNVDCQDGYIILELKERYQIEWLSVWGKTQKIRVKKDLLPVEDFGSEKRISELFANIEHGCLEGCSYQYRGTWYSYEKILDIQKKNQSNNWQAYV